jgi:6-phosphogluconolactonase
MNDRVAPMAPAVRAEVAVYPGEQELADAVARLFAGEARRAVERAGTFRVALAGGSTPNSAYRSLAAPPLSAGVPWDRVEVFWGDERCVDAGDPRSNEGMAREALLDHVGVPPEQVHPMRCTGAADAAQAAARYEELLRSALSGAAAPEAAAPVTSTRGVPAAQGLDLVLLGLGDDGHTASLFPGSSALEERGRWVTTSFGGGLPRLTLTPAFVNLSRLVVFVVAGGVKAEAVRRVLEGSTAADVALPARLIRPVHGRLVWLLDRHAAAQLAAALRQEGSL